MAAREWNDLPCELLQSIADRLGLIEFLSFRGVCKDWNSASSTASAEIEALPSHEPWFLLYGENSECVLIAESGRKYTITIPELNGATCLASKQGWLLLLREGSMFFFCPFSRARIDLPGQFPHTAIFDDHVAVFSSPPTSQDCVVCVVTKSDETHLKVHVIRRGDNAWTEMYTIGFASKIENAAYCNGAFYFFDDTDLMLYLGLENRRLTITKVRYTQSPKDKGIGLRFSTDSEKNDMKKRLGLAEGFPLSTCGTIVSGKNADKMVPYENTGNAKESGSRGLKGVWFQPRFHQIDQNHSW
ncbi:PREDICTED: F-box/kelch-repeat protein At1g57790 [Theobroma cacao]|uniref:F-box/kelch-repeat protein At1g57790 n=1 Tax=Theobroma cacao TaxID=3641 RepID=A0AB32W7G4_THECC|nr:PREDICTED: F-box/kelch-repeat protein At1g57790 [Theobroma cacao]